MSTPSTLDNAWTEARRRLGLFVHVAGPAIVAVHGRRDGEPTRHRSPDSHS